MEECVCMWLSEHNGMDAIKLWLKRYSDLLIFCPDQVLENFYVITRNYLELQFK